MRFDSSAERIDSQLVGGAMAKEMRGGAERSSTLPVARGLYVLRYLRSAERVAPPAVFFRAAPASATTIRGIVVPGRPEGRLEGPGACAVIVAAQDGELELTIRSANPKTKLDAVVRLDPLSNDENRLEGGAPPESGGLREAPSAYAANGVGDALIQVAAHVSRRGDVLGRAGDWIGGPQAPTPIEGFELRVGEQLRGAVEYQALTRGGWTDWVRPGVFLGSRGQATPLRGLRLRVSPDRPDVILEGEALFLGAPILRREGANLEFAPPMDADPLVGLKLRASIQERPDPKPGPEKVRVASESVKKNQSESSKKRGVKIFRRSSTP